MSKYKHILFDLDHTLWDFEKNATETLCELYENFQLTSLGNFSVQEFCQTFHRVNHHLWALHQQGAYEQSKLRSDRFKKIFSELGVAETLVPHSIQDEYLRICPSKPHVFPFTHDILEYLKERYQLHIVTNGFSDVQHIKLKSARLTDYFTHIVTSDGADLRKPRPGIFKHLLELIGADVSECIMIGDNLLTDIAGAHNANIDCIYFNPNKVSHRTRTTYEIYCLSELKGIL
ncbi:YjjG family noncanonical pyrimidine nucleotidase [Catalinimonas sp. 4WD22]|uniref:YjjG family noncanonical pyrimidine nucleotidase n=1 Tax=Catalinimonas locisalis TaxID=3133978 RepID=UPI00310173A9